MEKALKKKKGRAGVSGAEESGRPGWGVCPVRGGRRNSGCLPAPWALHEAAKDLTFWPQHRGSVGGKERWLKGPSGNHLPPLLFLAPFTWSRRVSVVMQIRRCWRCWRHPSCPPPNPSPPSPHEHTHTINWHICEMRLVPLPLAELAWSGVPLLVLRDLCFCHKDGQPPR